MTVKEWLLAIRSTEARMHALKAQKERIRKLAFKASCGRHEATWVSGTENRSRVEDAVCDALAFQERIDEEYAHSLEMMKDARELIDAVPDYHHRTLLDMRYLSGWDWAKISEELHLDELYAHRLHNKALVSAYHAAEALPGFMDKYKLEIVDMRTRERY